MADGLSKVFGDPFSNGLGDILGRLRRRHQVRPNSHAILVPQFDGQITSINRHAVGRQLLGRAGAETAVTPDPNLAPPPRIKSAFDSSGTSDTGLSFRSSAVTSS